MTNTAVGRELRQLRIKNGLTQHEIAAVLGKSVSFYSAIEVGRKVPTPEMIHSLAERYQLSELEVKRLDNLIPESVNQLRINLKSANELQKDTAVGFARRFNSLDEDQLRQIKNILEQKI